MHSLKYYLTILCTVSLLSVQAQTDSTKSWGSEAEDSGPYVTKTFKSTRVINFQTVETSGEKVLDFTISHRFGPINSGSYESYGIDGGASIRLGLDYSPTSRLMFGLGRSSYQKMFDGYAKYRLLRQTKESGMPISLSLFSGVYCIGMKDLAKDNNGYDKYQHFDSRLSFVHQIIVARKFGEQFSLEIAPWFVHCNQVDVITDLNDMYGVSAAMRFKFSKKFGVTGEYSYRINKYSRNDYYNSMGIGLELQTAGHIFQVLLTNSIGLAESQYLPYTNNRWTNAGIRLGFNIGRSFQL
jgi:hypothetical protein